MEKNEGELIRFSGRNIPVARAAELLHVEPEYVRFGILDGSLPIGVGFKKAGMVRYDNYISPKKLYEYCGIVVF